MVTHWQGGWLASLLSSHLVVMRRHNSAFQMLDPGLQRDAAAASVQPRRRAYRSGAGMASAASAPEHLSLTATQDVQLHSDPAVWQQPMNGRLCTHHEQGGAAQAPSLSVPGSVPLHGEAHTFQTIPRPFSGQRLYRHPSASSHPQSVSAFMLRQQQPQSPEVAAQIQQHRFEGQHLQQHLQQPRPPPALAMVRAHPHLQVCHGTLHLVPGILPKSCTGSQRADLVPHQPHGMHCLQVCSFCASVIDLPSTHCPALSCYCLVVNDHQGRISILHCPVASLALDLSWMLQSLFACDVLQLGTGPNFQTLHGL